MAIPELRNPPIVELVLGVVFEPIAQLDPMAVGRYWSERLEAFPHKRLVPGVPDFSRMMPHEHLHRCWLISHDDQTLVQIQGDRFYFNWRKRGSAYPRFRDHASTQGLLTLGLSEFARFADFCNTLGVGRPSATHVELTKVDRVRYTNREDLAARVRLVAGFLPVWPADDAELVLQVARADGDMDVRVALTSLPQSAEGESQVQIEMRAVRPLEGPVGRELFLDLNSRLNDVFEAVFSPLAISEFERGP